MFNIKKVKKLLRKGVCINADEEESSNMSRRGQEGANDGNEDEVDSYYTPMETYEEEADLDPPTDDLKYETTSNYSKIETVFEDAYSKYIRDIVNKVPENDPWMEDTCAMDAFKYTNPAIKNTWTEQSVY